MSLAELAVVQSAVPERFPTKVVAVRVAAAIVAVASGVLPSPTIDTATSSVVWVTGIVIAVVLFEEIRANR